MKFKSIYVVLLIFVATLLLQSGLEATWKEVPGSLSYVSVGCDGTAYGINAKGELLYWSFIHPNPNTWKSAPPMPDGAAQISVGCVSWVWGVNKLGKIYHFDNGWKQIPGSQKFKQVSAGCNQTVWALDVNNAIYQYQSTDSTWKKMPGAVIQISAGCDGTVWGVINNGIHLVKWTGTKWVRAPHISFSNTKSLSVGCCWEIWAVATVGGATNFKIFKTGDGYWKEIPCSFVPAQISAGCDGTVWAVDKDKKIYKWE
jgi:hypothetical protein